MRVRRLRLKNGYKRFFDLTIDLGESPKKIVALVGPNGCGKSSVLDGMLFLNNVHNKIGDQGRKDYRYHSMLESPAFSHESVEIDFVEGNFQQVREQLAASGKSNTIFSFRSPYRYNSKLLVNEEKAVSDIRQNSYGATVASDLDSKMEENYRRLRSAFNNHLHENDCRPSEAREKIIGELNASLRKCLDLEVVSIGDITSSKGTLFFRKSDQTKEFRFDVLSSGEKEVVDLLLDLYLRKKEYSSTVFLLDEPELHVSTSVQRPLLKEIVSLIGDNCQLWFTTHSIGFIRALQSDFQDQYQIIQFDPKNKFADQQYTLTPAVPSRENWRGLFSVALDDLADLVSPRQIIYCEGRDTPGRDGRERGIDAMIYNRIFAEKYPDTLFVSSGGNTELDQRSSVAIAILGKAISGLVVNVLKDRDMASGKITNESDRLAYLGTNPSSHRVLKRWEIENYLYDKEVLRAFSKRVGKVFDEGAYDDFVANIVDQNLKDDTVRIKNFCGVVGSIGTKEFKLSLASVIHEGMDVFRELEEVIFSRR